MTSAERVNAALLVDWNVQISLVLCYRAFFSLSFLVMTFMEQIFIEFFLVPDTLSNKGCTSETLGYKQ